MESTLLSRINIGKYSEAKLREVGIQTVEQLIETGAENAFIKIQTIDQGACLSLLYALEGAVEGIRWHDLSPSRKKELQEFFNRVKKV